MMKMQTLIRTHAALEGTTEEQILDSKLGSKPVEVWLICNLFVKYT